MSPTGASPSLMTDCCAMTSSSGGPCSERWIRAPSELLGARQGPAGRRGAGQEDRTGPDTIEQGSEVGAASEGCWLSVVGAVASEMSVIVWVGCHSLGFGLKWGGRRGERARLRRPRLRPPLRYRNSEFVLHVQPIRTSPLQRLHAPFASALRRCHPAGARPPPLLSNRRPAQG